MNFQELHASIPYVLGGKEKVLTMSPYPGIELAMPGRHSLDTTPPGGDFVVRVTDKGLKWRKHEFTHTDIFNDVQMKQRIYGPDNMFSLMSSYASVISDDDYPGWYVNTDFDAGLPTELFLQAVQALAVAEHRRYPQHERKFGGRFLPYRFAAGIAEGLWTAVEASLLQRQGRGGVEMLEKSKDVPLMTKELMGK